MNVRLLFALLRNVRIKSFEKGEIIIQKGSKKKDLCFIRRGLVRSYSINEDNEETTFQLYAESQFFANAHSVLLNEASKFDYQALEHTKVYTADYDAFLKFSSKKPDLLELNRTYFGKKIMKQAFQRVESFVFLSPEERYQKYVIDNPNIINRAPDKYIANVLGITPVSLSRIRRRIVSKNK